MSRNCRFTAAVHVCAVLAAAGGDGATSRAIAESLNTNPVVVRRLLAALVQTGLVASRRGSGGGYRLAKPAEAINLAMIAEAVDTDDGPAFGRKPPNPACQVGRSIQGVLSDALARAEAAWTAELRQTSLSEIVARLSASGT